MVNGWSSGFDICAFVESLELIERNRRVKHLSISVESRRPDAGIYDARVSPLDLANVARQGDSGGDDRSQEGQKLGQFGAAVVHNDRARGAQPRLLRAVTPQPLILVCYQLVSELLVINRGETGFIASVENLLGCRRIEVYVGFRRENQNRTARGQSLPAQLEVADYVDRFVVTARDAKTTFDAISFNDLDSLPVDRDCLYGADPNTRHTRRATIVDRESKAQKPVSLLRSEIRRRMSRPEFCRLSGTRLGYKKHTRNRHVPETGTYCRSRIE